MSNVGLGKGGRHCAVNNCSNGDYGLKKWAKAVCTKHGCLQVIEVVIVVHHMNYITFQHE